MQPNTTQHISNTSLIAGFSIMIVLLVGLMISSIFVLDKNLANIESLVQTTSVKSRLSTELRTAARERIIRLQQIALEKDIFRQDEAWIEFLEYGTLFITTRDTIRKMPLSENELDLLAKLDEVISLIGPVQADIAEKLQYGHREKGIELVLTRASELQSQAFAILTDFIVLQEKSAADSLTVADAGHGEILLRMLSDSGELVPPLAFIPAAERYNLMAKIDKWVIENVIRMLQDIPASTRLPDHCWISINLSAQTLNDESIHDFILDQLSHCPIPADKFCFEVTETYAIAHLSKTRNLINRLKSSGCRFALDDFGSGLSSFAYLKNLPVDYLKIDGCFTRNIHDDEMDYALVESINQIGHILGMKTVAEYVDSEDKMDQLIKIGVDFAQGYYIGRPQPFELFTARLQDDCTEPGVSNA